MREPFHARPSGAAPSTGCGRPQAPGTIFTITESPVLASTTSTRVVVLPSPSEPTLVTASMPFPGA